MDEGREQQVRERAYASWEREGCPEGQVEQHRFRAEAELRAEERGQSAGAANRSGERPDHPWTKEMVAEADEESFTASDPPAWMPSCTVPGCGVTGRA